jgi:hypothetical protein
MNRRRSYSYIYNVQRIILLVFFVTTAIALSIPLTSLVLRLSPDLLYPVVITLVSYVILVVILGSLIHVISFIPFNLATAFDPIKNDIAAGKISTMEQLGERITAFTVEFYNFSFLDISHAYLQTKGSGILGHEKSSQIDALLDELKMLEKSRELEEITRAGTVTLPDRDYHLYILPIWFGDQWLGYMALLSERKISHFFQRFLMEYEENFLDDQVMHLTRYNIKLA